MTDTVKKVDLCSLSARELADFMEDMGEKPFRARQIMKWLFKSGAADFEEMTDLSRSLRQRLREKALINRPVRRRTAKSEDGSIKFLWELEDGANVESVLIPERGHYTLCVSSQVGCAMGCRFCRTASLGLRRNLTQSEIIGQFLGAREVLPPEEKLTNMVFMGMGEPLANRENVVKALKILTEPGLVGLSTRHISLSTVGLIPELPKLAREVTLGLTVSLNAADDRTRSYLMPINRRYPMEQLHRALAAFPLPRGRRITIAYVLLDQVNDSVSDARALSRFLHGLKVKINLIPFNTFPGSGFNGPSEQRILAFQDVLLGKNHTVIIRMSKGRDISAACGQLAGEAEEMNGRGENPPA